MTFSYNLASLEPSTCKSTQLTVFSCCQMPLGVIWNSISNFHLSFWCWSSTFRSGEALAGVVPTLFFHCTHYPKLWFDFRFFPTEKQGAGFTFMEHGIQGAGETAKVYLLNTQLKRLAESLYKIRVSHKMACVNAARVPSADICQSLRRYKLQSRMLKDEFDLWDTVSVLDWKDVSVRKWLFFPFF